MPRLKDFDDPSFDVLAARKFSRGDTLDPYPIIHAAHARGTVHPGGYRSLFDDKPDLYDLAGFTQWMVFGYDNVCRIGTDPETFGSHEVLKHLLAPTFGNSVSQMDAPDHTRFRRIFQKAFLPQTVAKWGQSFVDPVVNRLVDKFIHRGEAELVGEFTHLYPFQVIFSQLGLPEELCDTFHRLAEAQLLNAVGIPQGVEASTKLGEFFEELVAIRRAKPGEDIVSHLATVEADGERLPDDVLIGFLRQLVNAGGDTTYQGTSTLFSALLNNPDQLQAVRQDRTLVPKAIEEGLRWDGPIISGQRYVTRDVEIDGHLIPAGHVVRPVRGSANRDPSKFEDPDRFDIFRDHPVRPIPFGVGPHVCIGQHLAKLEMSRALNAILDRLPNLRLDPAYPPPHPVGYNGRVPDHIHVKFDAA